MKVKFVDASGGAGLSVKATDLHAVQITVDPQTERRELKLQIELPITGPHSWPVNDVAVFDSKGRAVAVRRKGIEWHKLLIRVTPEQSSFLVRTVKTDSDRPIIRAEKNESQQTR